MTPSRFSESGLDHVLSVLADRYEIDASGRITRVRNDGTPPRFVLGRAAEGCVWRFGARVDADLVRAAARLAAREPGRPAARPDAQAPPPPERLVMIERVFGRDGAQPTAQREGLLVDGVEIAELWTIA